MKKIAISICMLIMATCCFSQKKFVNSAENKLYEPIDLDGAKADIENAIKDPSTSNWVRTYYVAGQVYYKIYEREAFKAKADQSYSQDVINENLLNCVNAYLKAAELDMQPNEKGKVKPKYQSDIVKSLKSCSDLLVYEGNQSNNKGLETKSQDYYKWTVSLWKKYLELPTYNIMKGQGIETNNLYEDIKYYIIGAASQVPSEKAIMIKCMEDLKSSKDTAKAMTMYEWLYDTYQKDGDTTKFVKILQEGSEKFPSNKFLRGSLINYYLESNKTNEAMLYLDQAIAKDPQNTQFYNIKGNIFLRKEQFDDAISSYEIAIKNNPNDFDAQSLCGYCYIRKGDMVKDDASKLSLKEKKKYDAACTKANNLYKTALTYMEKAKAINSQDLGNLNNMQATYYKLGQGDKMNKIDEEIKAVQKNQK